MNSQALRAEFTENFDRWKPWHPFDRERASSAFGVYVFRVAGGSPIERVKGISDIVYIGSGKIGERLRAHANPDWDNWDDSGWLICLIARARELEVAWVELPEGDARLLELKILEAYVLDHFELPPANRRMPKFSQETRAQLILHSLSPGERQARLGEMAKRQT